MSVRLRFLLLLFALAGVGWVAPVVPDLWETIQGSNDGSTDLSGTELSIVYVLGTANELQFDLPPKSLAVRIVSNPNIEALEHSQVGEGARYRLGYQVDDHSSRLLLSGDYNKPISATRFRGQESTGEPLPSRSFYLDDTITPLDAQMMRLKLTGFDSEPSRLRLRLLEAPPITTDVVVRVFALLPTPEHQQRFQWQRLNSREKARRSQANVYPFRLLTSTEVRDLVEKVWTPLAPLGIEGEDYSSRDLYLRLQAGERVREEPILPQGLVVDTFSRGVFWVPRGTTRLRIEPLVPDPDQRDDTVRFWWQDSVTGQTKQLARPWAPHIDLDLGAGLLELNTPVPSLVRAYEVVGEAEREVEPTLGLVRYYTTTATETVEYDVEHVGSAKTPFRLDLRVLADGRWDDPGRTPSVGVRYEARNSREAVVAKGVIDHPVQFSRYDHTRTVSGLQAASERSSSFLALPPGVTRLSFRADSGTVLIAGFNRPPDLPRAQRIPEETTERAPQDLLPAVWFAVRPRDSERLRDDDRSFPVYVQQRPAERDPDILAGDYFWEDFQPEDTWRGRYLLVPRDGTPEPPVTRERGLATIYHPVAPDRDVTVTFASRFLAPMVEPTLLYFRDHEAPDDIEVQIDGTTVVARSVGNRSGELVLPSVSPGQHVLRIRSDPRTAWFVNHDLRDEKESYIRRLAIRLPNETFTVSVEKSTHEEEVLSFRLFLPGRGTGRTRVRVRLVNPSREAIEPLAGWTFADRVYDLRPAVAGMVRVLDTPGETVDLGQRFFFVLGRDLPPGRYQLEVSPDANTNGYLTLHRVIPGSFEDRYVFSD